MAVIRVKHLNFESIFDVYDNCDTLDKEEWKDTSRINEDSWQARYEYASKIILDVINSSENPINSILEIGSGPGILSQKIQEKIKGEVQYHLVDKPYAKDYFEKKKFKGTFFVKDISNGMNTSGLLSVYDLIICNDTLEHLLNPSSVVQSFYSLMSTNSILFISVPNWRMGHQFVYRGLWDYDNFLFFMFIHRFSVITVYPSILTTPAYPKLDSEEEMPDELLQSWNWYFTFKKNK